MFGSRKMTDTSRYWGLFGMLRALHSDQLADAVGYQACQNALPEGAAMVVAVVKDDVKVDVEVDVHAGYSFLCRVVRTKRSKAFEGGQKLPSHCAYYFPSIRILTIRENRYMKSAGVYQP